MLEGQVAVLSSGLLSGKESLALLDDPPPPGTLSVLPAKIRLPLPGSRLTCTSRATVVSYLAAMSLSVSPSRTRISTVPVP